VSQGRNGCKLRTTRLNLEKNSTRISLRDKVSYQTAVESINIYGTWKKRRQINSFIHSIRIIIIFATQHKHYNITTVSPPMTLIPYTEGLATTYYYVHSYESPFENSCGRNFPSFLSSPLPSPPPYLSHPPVAFPFIQVLSFLLTPFLHSIILPSLVPYHLNPAMGLGSTISSPAGPCGNRLPK